MEAGLLQKEKPTIFIKFLLKWPRGSGQSLKDTTSQILSKLALSIVQWLPRGSGQHTHAKQIHSERVACHAGIYCMLKHSLHCAPSFTIILLMIRAILDLSFLLLIASL